MTSTPAIANIDLSNQVSVQVARKVLDMQKQQGQAALELLQAASEVQSDQVSHADGHLDTYA